ncbi:hypothetical protein HanRHA438_Chr14g0641801 [Helianthus annuus]|uniref:Uncharacterized protein n=1 Tax=Helianthus annuus TaxID=4232 RepID=A0A251SIT4_HELAN|nr:hypothetical protein HanXRQr2_Chr14g0630801 [Helianthus annuus]KAJ0839288.1 hypothetical protein HanPSC8_Chr14g0605031 [Helianthus annuus]KAJ0852622.1 hypothetical protein HanRHA438_Chr14g0641801 [Helianthus annuus]
MVCPTNTPPPVSYRADHHHRVVVSDVWIEKERERDREERESEKKRRRRTRRRQ